MTDEIVLSVLSKGEGIQVELRGLSGEFFERADVPIEPLDTVLQHWRSLREQASWSEEQARAIGRELAQALAPASIRNALRHKLVEVFERQRTVRLSLDCQDPLLRDLPWEYLHFEDGQMAPLLDGPLILHPGIRLCRRAVRSTQGRRTPPPELRIAIFTADPDTPRFPKLSWLYQEMKSIRSAFRKFDAPEIAFKVVADVVPAVLGRHLREFEPHIVHFAGHAEATATGGVLVLQGAEPGTASLLHAEEFGKWLKASGVELLFLSACNTSGSLEAVAATVQREGVPCVVAMQTLAKDAFLPQLSREFYGTLSEGATACDAMALARSSLVGGAWGIPTLSFSAEPQPFVAERTDRSGPISPHNLFKYDRKLVGRERETAELVEAIAKGSDRLITLTGPGGMGKTHLAVQAGWRLLRDFPDGVWFVDCALANDAEELFTAIAMTIPKEPGESSLDTVFDRLKDKSLFLILDRFEHLVPAECSDAIAKLLHLAQSVSILVTSRSPLKLPAERPYPVPPLIAGPELFVDSSALERRRLTEDDLHVIGQICERVGGIPWAIIVAAGRTKVLTPVQLLDLLNESALRTLEGGNLNERLLDLVPEADRRLLWKLSVFKGSFTWEDVKAVYDDDEHDLVNGIQRLAEQSLLSGLALRRFKLLDVVREYTDNLVDDEASVQERQTARMRLAAHFCCEAERLAVMDAEGKRAESVDAVWAGLENFRAAILWCGKTDNHPQVSRFAYALSATLMEGGLWLEFEVLAELGYKAAKALSDPKLTAKLLGLEGAMEARRGNEAKCRDLWRERAEICIEIGDFLGAADALIDIAVQILQHDSEHFDKAAQLLSDAEDLLNRNPGAAPDLVATVAILRARTELRLDHQDLAMRYLDKTVEAALTITSKQDAALFVDLNIGHFWREAGDYPKAEVAYIKVVRAAREANRHVQVAASLSRLSVIYEQTSHVETAYLCLAAAAKILEQLSAHKAKLAKEDLRAFVERQPRDWSYLVDLEDVVSEILKRSPLLSKT